MRRPSPANQPQVYISLLHHRDPPLLIKPKCIVTYYTKPVYPIKK